MEYLDFKTLPTDGKMKTEIVAVTSRRSGWPLGTIKWYGPWRQYTFRPVAATVFNPDCLRTIADVCAKMTSEHRTHLAERRRGG